jgi:hypothetical protein
MSAAERRCVSCGSPDINLWKSWNVVGEWICYECAPSDPVDEEEW